MIAPKLPDNHNKVGTYEIQEKCNNRFYPGKWVFRTKRVGWFRSEQYVAFEYLVQNGQPWGNYEGRPIPPAAGPFSTLEAAREFIRNIKSNSGQKEVPSKFHKA